MSKKLGLFLAGTVLATTLPAYGQATGGQAAPAAQTPPPPAATETRPATTTFLGDTGLWFVPTGEVLGPKKVSFSVYRVDQNYNQGFTNASFWPVTIGVGLGERAELFGAVLPVVRIDRDIRPVFVSQPEFGGAVADYPRMNQYWSGNAFGDIYLGAKINLLSEYRQQPAAVAVRGAIKLPTGDDAKGAGTGATDFLFDAIVSKEVNQRVEVAGFAGYRFRGSPDNFDLPGSFRYGFGAGFPTRKNLRLTAELHGQTYGDVTYSGTGLTAIDGSVLPALSTNDAVTAVALGLTWQSAQGVFVGAGIDWNLNLKARTDAGAGYGNDTGDAVGLQFRLGYHPGVRVYVPPPPPPPPPTPPANNPPTVKARCEPCQVEVGKSATVIADAQDPDGDQLKYKWAAPAGTLQNPADRQTLWTAPMEPGPVPITVTVDDGKGGTASDTVTIQVTRPPVKEFVFEDVHFDFDRYSLRPEATRILDEAVKALQENPDLRIEVEGHTCNIGTAEYNLALGERRANAVREYLTSRGINADRLRTVSYGEERPKYDNSREETRRLNRRAALVVRVTKQ